MKDRKREEYITRLVLNGKFRELQDVWETEGMMNAREYVTALKKLLGAVRLVQDAVVDSAVLIDKIDSVSYSREMLNLINTLTEHIYTVNDTIDKEMLKR